MEEFFDFFENYESSEEYNREEIEAQIFLKKERSAFQFNDRFQTVNLDLEKQIYDEWPDHVYYFKTQSEVYFKQPFGIESFIKDMNLVSDETRVVLCEPRCQSDFVYDSVKNILSWSDLENLSADFREYKIKTENLRFKDVRYALEMKYFIDNAKEVVDEYSPKFFHHVDTKILAKIQKPFFWPVINNRGGVSVLEPFVYFPLSLHEAAKEMSFYSFRLIDVSNGYGVEKIVNSGGFFVGKGNLNIKYDFINVGSQARVSIGSLGPSTVTVGGHFIFTEDEELSVFGLDEKIFGRS